MSFDWLNIPGLASDDNDVTPNQSGSLPPPSVSFNFGPTTANFNDKTTVRIPLKAPGNDPFFGMKAGQLNGNQQQLPNQQDKTRLHSNGTGRRDQQVLRNNTDGQAVEKSAQNHKQQQHIQHLSPPKNHTNTNSEQKYQETPDDLNVPLSLSRSQLTGEEARTYLRWYNFISLRTHSKLVRLADVFKFLSNFNMTTSLRERISTIFRTCKNALNIGQFFAVLRLVSKALIEGVAPCRKMILDKSPVPKPRPILNSDHESEIYEEIEEDEELKNGKVEEQKVDFDSFASLLLTGKSERKRIRRKIRNKASKNKRVRFSEHLTFQDAPSLIEKHAQHQDDGDGNQENESAQGSLDFSLPMDQLLKRLANKKNSALVSSLPDEKQETEEEKEVLEEMKDSLSHFKQIQTPDLASMAPTHMPPITVNTDENNRRNNESLSEMSHPPLEPLKPTSTGSANYLFRQQYNGGGMAQELPQTQSMPQYVSQYENQPVLQPLRPTATGSANYLVRNHAVPEHQDNANPANKNTFSDSSANVLEPLNPTATGSGNHFMKQQQHQQFDRPINMQISANILSPSPSPDIRVSPQTTGHMGQGGQLQAPQARMPLQQQISPQITPQNQQNSYYHSQGQNPNFLSAPNPASSYFQSLLSSTPSPNSSNANLPHLNNNSSVYQNPQNNPPLTSQSRASYNNGYQYYSPISPHQQQQQQQYSSANQPQQQPQSVNRPYTQHIGTSGGHGGIYSPSLPVTQSPHSGDILGDLQSLQQQVDALQNVYGRR